MSSKTFHGRVRLDLWVLWTRPPTLLTVECLVPPLRFDPSRLEVRVEDEDESFGRVKETRLEWSHKPLPGSE